MLSGINHGPSTGHAVLHSGTVGAALTASTHGVRAMAVSMATPEPSKWGAAWVVSRQALDWLLDASPDDPVVLNVNVPDLFEDRLRRTAGTAAPLRRRAGRGRGGRGRCRDSHLQRNGSGQDPGTDAALVADGSATVTPLRAPCEAREVDVSAMADRV